jgi:hypothetical protein
MVDGKCQDYQISEAVAQLKSATVRVKRDQRHYAYMLFKLITTQVFVPAMRAPSWGGHPISTE